MRPESGYAHDGRLLKGALGRTESVYVLRSYTVGGRQVVDCYHDQTGQVWQAVPVLTVGGAGAQSYDHVPLSTDTEGRDPAAAPPDVTNAAEALLLFRGPRRNPVLIGSFGHPQAEPLAPRPSSAPSPTAERLPAPSVSDRVIAHGGTKLIIGEHGDVTFDFTRATVPALRVQLPAAGLVRVSQGEEATDYATLALPLIDLLGDHEAAIAELQGIVNALVALMAPPNGPGGVPVVTVPPSALPAAVAVVPEAVDAPIKAACLRLSTEAAPDD